MIKMRQLSSITFMPNIGDGELMRICKGCPRMLRVSLFLQDCDVCKKCLLKMKDISPYHWRHAYRVQLIASRQLVKRNYMRARYHRKKAERLGGIQ